MQRLTGGEGIGDAAVALLPDGDHPLFGGETGDRLETDERPGILLPPVIGAFQQYRLGKEVAQPQIKAHRGDRVGQDLPDYREITLFLHICIHKIYSKQKSLHRSRSRLSDILAPQSKLVHFLPGKQESHQNQTVIN